METKPLKIIRLEASNIKRLKAVNIEPDGNVVVISGENDQGKSSVLDSILYALGGKDAICDVPIRAGAAKANIVCDLGELVVERTFSASGGTALKVLGKDRKALPSPQSVLDKLCSKVAFDPLSFVKMDPKERAETLRKLVGLDFTALNTARKELYDERSLTNRELETQKTRVAMIPSMEDVPEGPVSVTELMDKLTEIERGNAENSQKREALNRLKFARENAEMKIKECENAIVRQQATLKALKEQLKTEEATIAQHTEAVEKLVDVDVSELKTKITQADEINDKYRKNRSRVEAVNQFNILKKKSDDLTDKIKKIDDEKEKALSEANFPLPGLSFDDSGVILNGVPFSQGSQAQQLKAAIAVGLAINPTVRVILIRDASLLDKKNMAVVAEMAKTADAQIWLEVVNSNDQSAIVIEDGNVKDSKPVDEPKLL